MPRNGYKIFLRKIFLEKATRESLWKSMKIAKFPRVKKKKKKKRKKINQNSTSIIPKCALFQTYQEKKIK